MAQYWLYIGFPILRQELGMFRFLMRRIAIADRGGRILLLLCWRRRDVALCARNSHRRIGHLLKECRCVWWTSVFPNAWIKEGALLRRQWLKRRRLRFLDRGCNRGLAAGHWSGQGEALYGHLRPSLVGPVRERGRGRNARGGFLLFGSVFCRPSM